MRKNFKIKEYIIPIAFLIVITILTITWSESNKLLDYLYKILEIEIFIIGIALIGAIYQEENK